jgi:hypothetical protein
MLLGFQQFNDSTRAAQFNSSTALPAPINGACKRLLSFSAR